jgi:hypothetical protein
MGFRRLHHSLTQQKYQFEDYNLILVGIQPAWGG